MPIAKQIGIAVIPPTQGKADVDLALILNFHFIVSKRSPEYDNISYNWLRNCFKRQVIIHARRAKGTETTISSIRPLLLCNLHADDLAANCLQKIGEHVHKLPILMIRKKVDESLRWKLWHSFQNKKRQIKHEQVLTYRVVMKVMFLSSISNVHHKGWEACTFVNCRGTEKLPFKLKIWWTASKSGT